jgi:hypothetical protein
MSVLTTIPQELIAAAQQLEGVANSLAAQTAGAAAPTTAVAPAAADSVSTLQAAIYSTYGTWYQQIAAEAQAVQQQIVSTLGLNSTSYTSSEAANAAAASLADSSDPFSGIEQALTNAATFLGGPSASFGGSPFSTSGNAANFLSFESGNWASAMSDCLGMAGGGLIPADGPLGLGNLAGTAGDTGAAAAGAADAVGYTTPMGGVGGLGAMPVAGMGQATMVNSLSAPPAWASPVTPIAGTNAALPVQTVGWTSAAPQTGAPIAAFPGTPGASAARGSAMGAPRYGVKPIVMPKPAV